MSLQLIFNLPVKDAVGRADFMVAPSNAQAVATIEASSGWPDGKLILTARRARAKAIWRGSGRPKPAP